MGFEFDPLDYLPNNINLPCSDNTDIDNRGIELDNKEGSSINDPRQRLEAAFGDLGFGDEWDAWATDNGVMR